MSRAAIGTNETNVLVRERANLYRNDTDPFGGADKNASPRQCNSVEYAHVGAVFSYKNISCISVHAMRERLVILRFIILNIYTYIGSFEIHWLYGLIRVTAAVFYLLLFFFLKKK